MRRTFELTGARFFASGLNDWVGTAHQRRKYMYDQNTANLLAENSKLKEQLQFVNIASHSLVSLLCGVPTVSEKDGDLIRRESVMELVTQWRKNWDLAMKVSNVNITGTP